jgi:hypothetical protein
MGLDSTRLIISLPPKARMARPSQVQNAGLMVPM